MTVIVRNACLNSGRERSLLRCRFRCYSITSKVIGFWVYKKRGEELGNAHFSGKRVKKTRRDPRGIDGWYNP